MLQRTQRHAWGKAAPLEKRRAKSQLVVFMGLNDEPDPCSVSDLARLVLLCLKPRLAKEEQQALKVRYGQRLLIFKVKIPAQIGDTLYGERSESFAFHGFLLPLVVMGTSFP